MTIDASAPAPSTALTISAITPDTVPKPNDRVRSSASPTTPPSPVGSGHAGPFGTQDTNPAASPGASTQKPSRSSSRSNERWIAMRQPQTATGSSSTIEASPNN